MGHLLQAESDSTFLLDSNSKQRGAYEANFFGDEMEILTLGNGRIICKRQHFSEYYSAPGVKFASLEQLKTFLRESFFFSKSGGSGPDVDSAIYSVEVESDINGGLGDLSNKNVLTIVISGVNLVKNTDFTKNFADSSVTWINSNSSPIPSGITVIIFYNTKN